MRKSNIKSMTDSKELAIEGRAGWAREDGKFHSSTLGFVRLKVRVRHKPLRSLPTLKKNKDGHVYIKHAFFREAVIKEEGTEHLVIESNIPEYFTGQGLVGPENLKLAAVRLVTHVLKLAGIETSKEERADIDAGKIEPLIVHYAVYCDCGSIDAAEGMQLLVGTQYQVLPEFNKVYGEKDEEKEDITEGARFHFHDHTELVVVQPTGHMWEYVMLELDPRSWGRDLLWELAQTVMRFELVLGKGALKALGIRYVADWNVDLVQALLLDRVHDVIPMDEYAGLHGLRRMPLLQQARLGDFLRKHTNPSGRDFRKAPDLMKIFAKADHSGLEEALYGFYALKGRNIVDCGLRFRERMEQWQEQLQGVEHASSDLKVFP